MDSLISRRSINTYKTDPTNPDSDEDGTLDGDEVTVYGYAPTREQPREKQPKSLQRKSGGTTLLVTHCLLHRFIQPSACFTQCCRLILRLACAPQLNSVSNQQPDFFPMTSPDATTTRSPSRRSCSSPIPIIENGERLYKRKMRVHGFSRGFCQPTAVLSTDGYELLEHRCSHLMV